jgi:fumarate reductase subunit C
MRSLRHLDTSTWALQIITGIAILVLASIHLWVILTDLPIEAEKSGIRVFARYFWLYAPFIVLIEAHLTFGVYRVAMKWGLLGRRFAHPIFTVWTVGVLALGFAILVELHRVGGDL